MLAGLIWSEHTCRSHGRQGRRCCVRPRAPARPSESAASAGDLAYNHESWHPESVPDLLPGVSDSVPSAIILQPKCSVRDCLRWGALGNWAQVFAGNSASRRTRSAGGRTVAEGLQTPNPEGPEDHTDGADAQWPPTSHQTTESWQGTRLTGVLPGQSQMWIL